MTDINDLYRMSPEEVFGKDSENFTEDRDMLRTVPNDYLPALPKAYDRRLRDRRGLLADRRTLDRELATRVRIALERMRKDRRIA